MNQLEYISGYKDGFGDGWNAAKKEIEHQLREVANQCNKSMQVEFAVARSTAANGLQTDYCISSKGCSVCGIGANGDPFGYVCQHPQCPARITY